jgi:signal transduction histidine kinase
MSEENEPQPDLERGRIEFVDRLSREFRTPLMLLLGPLQAILDSPASALAPASRTVLETARRNALRLLTLLDTVPDPARVERGPAAGAREPADLATFTTDLASYFRPACDAAGLRLTVDCPPLPASLDLDRDAWEKIVLNLVANAVKSTIEGTIEVGLRAHDGRARLVVSDTGSGFPESELRYVFAASDGSGFGLPFVRELVQQHNGSIEVQSTPGRGTSFTVLLPFGADALSPRPGSQRPGDTEPPTTSRGSAVAAPLPASRDARTDVRVRATDRVTGSRGHVVIAEDHVETRLYLAHVLETAGFTVDALADGIAALTACQIKAPDALVSDVLMPGLDGFQLIERLRRDERTAVIPVLLLSARGGEDSRIEGIAAGADDYLVKPLSGRELVARVDGAVRLARLRRETARREQERVRELSGRLVEVQEAERRELSAELHDRTSPQLAAIQINLAMVNTLLGGRETEDLRALLDDTAGLVADTTIGIREISSNLRPTVLDDGGLLPALSGYAEQFAQRTGIAVQLDTKNATSTLTAAVQSSLFRIVQEALTNCAKHASARNVTIELGSDDANHVWLAIADDGVGFDLDRHSRSGLGLLTMRERAEFHGGRFSLETTPGHGTRIRVIL